MQAVVNLERKPYRVELEERPTPHPDSDEVLLRVGSVGVCGSDLHQWHATHPWNVNYPVVLGHEFSGTVAATGSGVTGFRAGDRVTSETAARVCGDCALCRTGMYNLCPHRLGFGYGVDGAMAEYVRVPARCLHRLPNNVSLEDAAMTEPACVAANAVLELSHVQPGDFVVVLGPGPIGLLCLQMARLCGAGELWMIGTSRDTARLEVARQVGATRTLVVEGDLAALVKQTGDRLGPHLVVDAVGHSEALRLALDLVRPAGEITKVGWGPQAFGFSLDPLVAKAIKLQGSFSHTWKTWERVLGLFALRRIQLDPLRRVFLLSQWREAFETMDRLDVAKSVLIPGE